MNVEFLFGKAQGLWHRDAMVYNFIEHCNPGKRSRLLNTNKIGKFLWFGQAEKSENICNTVDSDVAELSRKYHE